MSFIPSVEITSKTDLWPIEDGVFCFKKSFTFLLISMSLRVKSIRSKWLLPKRAWRESIFSPKHLPSATIDSIKSKAVNKASRSGKWCPNPTPPDSSPPIRTSLESISSAIYLNPTGFSSTSLPKSSATNFIKSEPLTVLTTQPGIFLTLAKWSIRTGINNCVLQYLPFSSIAAIRSPSPSKTRPMDNFPAWNSSWTSCINCDK